MKNTLEDLNNHLFAELERLGDEDMGEEQRKAEIERARAISKIAQGVISNGNLALRAYEMQGVNADAEMPKMLGVSA